MSLNNPEQYFRVRYFLLKTDKTDLQPIFYHVWDQIRLIHLGFDPFGTRSGIQYIWEIIPLGNNPMGFGTFGKLSVYHINRLRSTHCREFNYLKLCRTAYFVRTTQWCIVRYTDNFPKVSNPIGLFPKGIISHINNSVLVPNG